MDVTKWEDGIHGNELRERYPGRRPVIFASPPCEEYSLLNANSPRNFLKADRCVDMVRHIAEDLEAAFVFVENPSTGLLPGRPVIESWTVESIEVCYCQYGFLYKKPTRIWVSAPLTGMQPKMCPGGAECPSSYYNHLEGKHKHLYRVTDVHYDDRIRVPDQLILALAIGALPAIRAELAVPREDRGSRVGTRVSAGAEFEVQDVVDSSISFIGGRFQLSVTVSWQGYDHTEELPVDQLTAPLSSYSFRTKAIEKAALKNMDYVIRMNRIEDDEEQAGGSQPKKKRQTRS